MQIRQQKIRIKFFLETLVELLHYLVVLEEDWYSMLIKLVAILDSPPIEVSYVVAEDSEHDLVF
jgi:hypothetical protein